MERPSDVDDRDLAQALTGHWGLREPAVAYAPVGFGGHHWHASTSDGERRFVTLTDGDAAPLRASMEASAALASAGLDFVVAPLPTRDGDLLAAFGHRQLTVFPHVDGEAGRWSDVPPEPERKPMAALLAELHTVEVPGVPVHDTAVAERANLDASLEQLGEPWTGGPYAEPARALLSGHAEALRAVLAAYDATARRVAAMPHVITHGEPHQGNVLHARGRRLLIDWDTVRLAPPERDLWIGVGADPAALAAYAERTGHVARREVMEFYRLRWMLEDLALYTAQFRAPHGDDGDTRTAWGGFAGSLREVGEIGRGTGG